MAPREQARMTDHEPDGVSDEQLWSWIDEGASALDEHLAAHPEDPTS